MSSCISGGGRLYTLDLEIIKSSSNSTTTSHTSSSPSSTLSESSNSPLAISTRKPRTPRKRPNQIYNEAAALLSTAYPNIFPSSTKNQLAKPRKFSSKAHDSFSYDESNSELLFPFRVVSDGSGFLLRNQPIPEKSTGCLVESKEKSGTSANSGEVNSHGINEMEVKGGELEDDFDAESILDEEIEEGIIDSIMGNLSVEQDTFDESNGIGAWYGNPMGLGFGGYGFGFRRGVRALRHVDEGNWWNSPTVDVLQISPKTNTTTTTKVVAAATTGKAEKKKKKVVEKPIAAVMEETNKENPSPTKPRNTGLSLKLNYEDVVNAWSDRASPFSDDAQLTGNDLHARLAQIDLFSEGGWVREASVLRYKEKRRTRLFSKKIRYQVRKVNADRRPRMKGLKDC